MNRVRIPTIVAAGKCAVSENVPVVASCVTGVTRSEESARGGKTVVWAHYLEDVLHRALVIHAKEHVIARGGSAAIVLVKSVR